MVIRLHQSALTEDEPIHPDMPLGGVPNHARRRPSLLPGPPKGLNTTRRNAMLQLALRRVRFHLPPHNLLHSRLSLATCPPNVAHKENE